MRKEVSFKNRDRFIQLGIAISSLRKVRGMSQEKLAEKAGISRSLLSVIEAPNTANSFSLEVLYDIADALEVTPADLINASLDSIETELLAECEKNPPSSILEAVSQIKEKFGITLTETPVRYWLRKRGFVTSNQSRYRQKQT